MNDYPKPPFPKQHQPVPGSQRKMDPYPDCGEQSYKGSGRLSGKIALITGVQFEWLATGRGKMDLSLDTVLDSVAAADATLVDHPLELRLLAAFRHAPLRAKAPLVEVVEQMAELRTGRAPRGARRG